MMLARGPLLGWSEWCSVYINASHSREHYRMTLKCIIHARVDSLSHLRWTLSKQCAKALKPIRPLVWYRYLGIFSSSHLQSEPDWLRRFERCWADKASSNKPRGRVWTLVQAGISQHGFIYLSGWSMYPISCKWTCWTRITHDFNSIRKEVPKTLISSNVTNNVI